MKKLVLLSSLLFLILACDKEIVDADPLFIYQAIGDGKIKFTSEAKNAKSFEWDFGDGNTSKEKNPVHQYYKNGNYTVVLTAKNKKNKVVKFYDLVVADVPKPVARFSATQGANGKVSFKNLSKYYTRLSWNFHNGDTSNVENPTVNYIYNNEYFVILTATSPQGLSQYGVTLNVTSLPPNKTGDTVFWTKTAGPNINIYIDEKYMGTITKSTDSAPSCRAPGFVTLSLPTGMYILRVEEEAPNSKTSGLIFQEFRLGYCKKYEIVRK